MGRFINADAYASTGQGLLGNNMYAYCNNCPASYVDPAGYYMVNSVNDERIYYPVAQRQKPKTSQKQDVVPDASIDKTNVPTKHTQNANVNLDSSHEESRIDYEYVCKKTLISGIGGIVGGAVTGWVAGYMGVPFTAGMSLPACAIFGGITAGAGGFACGFVTALLEEIFE